MRAQVPVTLADLDQRSSPSCPSTTASYTHQMTRVCASAMTMIQAVRRAMMYIKNVICLRRCGMWLPCPIRFARQTDAGRARARTHECAGRRPLLGQEQISQLTAAMSANDPTATWLQNLRFIQKIISGQLFWDCETDQLAPLSRQDVVQLMVVPPLQTLHTSTHSSNRFAS